MDYQALSQLITIAPQHWKLIQIQKWLSFIGLDKYINIFTQKINDGKKLLNLSSNYLDTFNIKSCIIKRKIIRWVQQGLPSFNSYINQDKENINPNLTNQYKIPSLAQRKSSKSEKQMVIKTDSNNASYFIVGDRTLTIGRSHHNLARSLQVSVQNQHAQIFKKDGKNYIVDKGTFSGTYIKISQPVVLKIGSLIQIGSFNIQILTLMPQIRQATLLIKQMTSGQTAHITIVLDNSCSQCSFGRKKTNSFYFNDEHLSNHHARIYILRGNFVIHDLGSTNGTWLRLSKPKQYSKPFPLEIGNIFKIGTTVTYECQQSKDDNYETMDIQYPLGCVSCSNNQRDVVFMPCRHNVLCNGCAQICWSCPLCGQTPEEKIRIYI